MTSGADDPPDPGSLSGPGVERSPEGFVEEPAGDGPVNHAMLYIEDNEDNIVLVEALIRRRPHIELHLAMNGRDGVQAAIDKRPGLILLDNRLPDATGGEILRTPPRRPLRGPPWSSSAATPTRSSMSC
jgi:CheY-like chemotaxis protein